MARIGVDLDGVVYDFGASLKHYLVTHEGFDPNEMSHPKVWDFFLDWGLSVEEYLELYAKGVDAGIVLLHGDSHEGAKECLDSFRENGHTIHIATFRTVGEKAVHNTLEWLRREKITYDTITFAKDKTIIDVDIFIEDNIDNYNALDKKGVKVFLMDRPWNRDALLVRRVYSWDHFYEEVSEIVEGNRNG